MTLTPEMQRLIDERVESKLAEVMQGHDSKATLLTSTDAAIKLRLPIARFMELAKGIPVVKFGEDRRKNWYTLHDLLALVEKHKLPPMGR